MSSELLSKPSVTVVLVIIIAIAEAILLLAGQNGWH